ncbi:MAG: rRNA maturation RNase YbeY [Chloroflexi bacterium]|nr:rRNA maturation RNase YbeY [Chloroflexota bacterium]
MVLQNAPDYEIEVQIAPEFADLIDGARVADVARAVLHFEGWPTGTALAVVISGDPFIQALNRTYRQTDRPTDVLAFAAQEGADFVVADEEAGRYLGDVLISYDTALAQAAEQGHPVEEELNLLIIHGCLHLLGYDDEEPEARSRMWARQEEILRALANYLT